MQPVFRLFVFAVFVLLVTTGSVSAYTITASSGAFGSINPSGQVGVSPGGDQLFLMQPNDGYHLQTLAIDGKMVPVTPAYRFSSVSSDHTIYVTFGPDSGSVELSSTPNGARIYIDGVDSGSSTPGVLDVPVGIHSVDLVKQGYEDYSTQVTVYKDQTTTIPRVNLNPLTTIPTTTVTTVPTTTITPTSTTKPPTTTTVTTVATTTITTTRTQTPTSTRTTAPVTTTKTSQTTTTTPTATTAPGTTTTGTVAPTSTTPVTTEPTQILTLNPNTILPTPTDTLLLPTTVPEGTTIPVTTSGINGSPVEISPGQSNTSGQNGSGILPATTVMDTGSTTPHNPDQGISIPANITGAALKPPGGLSSWNVVFFLFIAVIPLVLLLTHDYLGLGHMTFPQPLLVRIGVALGQVLCGGILLYVLYRMIALLPMLTGTLALPVVLIVLLLLAYLIFSALALASGSLISSPLRWTLKVHVVISVVVLIITPIILFSLSEGEAAAILAMIVAAPLSALLALWQDHSLALHVLKNSSPFRFFGMEETRVPTDSELSRRGVTTRPDIFPPELQDRYTNIDFLGLGGISHVFRAMRLRDGKTVAVKIPIRFDETTGKCFMKEILAWEGLRHQNIVEITEVNILPVPYVEMEFVKSGLAGMKTPMPIRKASEIVLGVAEGLAYAHGQGIIHRDIKPQNILIDSNEVPKISDWGMSRVMGTSAVPTVAGFSLAYASPEQISPGRFGETDERTDIYQLGAVFYELVTGKLLFPGDDLADVSNAIVSRTPPLPSEINPLARPLDGIIMKCLQKEQRNRYQSVREFKEDLSGIMDSLQENGTTRFPGEGVEEE